ncbi:MAG: hypothetical protein AAGL49_07545 [Pseudomonadota bacterium]
MGFRSRVAGLAALALVGSAASAAAQDGPLEASFAQALGLLALAVIAGGVVVAIIRAVRAMTKRDERDHVHEIGVLASDDGGD